MLAADVIVLTSPIYFYSMTAQLKAVIDRTVEQIGTEVGALLRWQDTGQDG